MMTPTLVLLALWTNPPPSENDPAPETRLEARRLRDEAYRRLLDDDYAAGIERLEAAYDLVPNPGLLLNVLIAYRRWPGHCREAYATYRRFEAACGSECEFHREGAEQLAAVDAKCMAPVTFTSPSPTAIFVDDKAVGKAPCTVRLRPGRHRVRTSTVSFEIEVEPENPQSVFVPSASLTAPPKIPPRDAAAFGLIGLGAGAAVLGATFTGLAVDGASTLDEARDRGAPDGELARLAAQQDRDAAVAVVGWSVAVASTSAALVLLFTRERDEAPRIADAEGAEEVGRSQPAARAPGDRSFGAVGRGLRVGPGALELRF